MKRIICIPDSFKGTLSSSQIIHIVQACIKRHLPNLEVIGIQVADGGEGTVDAFLSISPGDKVLCEVAGPGFEQMKAFYGVLSDRVAVIEMAACAGLPLVQDHPNPLVTTTFGVGELMMDAYQRGCRKMIVGLGGSATNDGGCGAAAALGYQFFDEQSQPFIPTGETLHRIARIDASLHHPLIDACEIITMCDIDNPLFGEQGAAYVFAPQKGADALSVQILDKGLRHLAQQIELHLSKQVADITGAGAAGGMGAGMVAFLNSNLQSGIETILDVAKFDDLLKSCDLVVTGEGQIDAQTLRGKVPLGVAQRAKRQGVKVICIVGSIEEGIEELYDKGITAIFSINQQPVDYQIAKTRADENLAVTVDNLTRLISAIYDDK